MTLLKLTVFLFLFILLGNKRYILTQSLLSSGPNIKKIQNWLTLFSKAADLASKPRNVPELIEYWGYDAQVHRITTADGYILTVHRIPPTALQPTTTQAESPSSSSGLNGRPIAFLLHGIFGTSARWTLGPPDKVVKKLFIFPLRPLCSLVANSGRYF